MIKKIIITTAVFFSLLAPCVSFVYAQDTTFTSAPGTFDVTTPVAPSAPGVTNLSNVQTNITPATPSSQTTTFTPAAPGTFNVTGTPQSNGASAGSAPTAGGSGTQPPVTLQNPLKYTSIDAIVKALIDVIEYIGAIACALWIIWAGFLYVKAQGKPEALTEANKTLLHAIIGTAIILGAGAILTVIQSTITSIKS